jgi:hypothetical protein
MGASSPSKAVDGHPEWDWKFENRKETAEAAKEKRIVFRKRILHIFI